MDHRVFREVEGIVRLSMVLLSVGGAIYFAETAIYHAQPFFEADPVPIPPAPVPAPPGQPIPPAPNPPPTPEPIPPAPIR